MKYLRRTADGQAIYNCPDCGCELHASKELLRHLMNDFWAKGGRVSNANMTPEQRSAKGKKAVEARWAKARLNGTVRKSE